MHSKGQHPHQDAQARGLQSRALHTKRRNESPADSMDLMPFIDVGTFFVAAYLRLNLHTIASR
jgi:hypothetical protein